MKMRYLLLILLAIGGWYYYTYYYAVPEPPPPAPVVKQDPGKAKHARSLIYFHQRRIDDLENQNWRQRRGSVNDNNSRIKRDEEIAKLRKEIAKLQGEAGGN